VNKDEYITLPNHTNYTKPYKKWQKLISIRQSTQHVHSREIPLMLMWHHLHDNLWAALTVSCLYLRSTRIVHHPNSNLTLTLTYLYPLSLTLNLFLTLTEP